MKSILIAATVVGAFAAGLILYLQYNKTTTKTEAGNVVDAASEAYNVMHTERMERPSQHAMG